MLGTIINTVSVICGSTIGLILNKGIPERLTDQMMRALGLCTLFIGVQGAFKGENTLIMILSMVLGVIIGEGIDIDDHVTQFLNRIEKKIYSQKRRTDPFLDRRLYYFKSFVLCRLNDYYRLFKCRT